MHIINGMNTELVYMVRGGREEHRIFREQFKIRPRILVDDESVKKARLALARAVYGEPALVVLDEPNSNLDGAGDIALAKCIQQLRQRGTTVVLVSHQQGLLAVTDKLLVLNDGTVASYGARAEVLERLQPRRIGAARSA